MVSNEASRNWGIILFLSGLALIMISSSHSIDRKVRRLSQLSEEVKELKSEFVDTRISYMQSQMESKIISEMEARGFIPSPNPPKRIRILTGEQTDSEWGTRIANRD